MIICSNCDESIDEKESFCTQCGNLLSETIDSKETPTIEQNVETNESSETSLKKGKLVFPDDSEIEIDESQRLVGREDLKLFLNEDSTNISRGHFTIFEESNKCYLEDGSTNVQHKASEKHTILNDDDITGKGKIELNDDDLIKVSNIVLHFKRN